MTKRLARDPARRCKKLPEWPAQDRALWEAALRPGDIIDPGGIRAGLAARSNHKMAVGYGRWLQWLDHGGELDPIQQPGARITQERVSRYIDALTACNSTQTLVSRLVELHQVARVMDPARDWSWIRQAVARLRARTVPARPKAARLAGADELYNAGWQLMTDAGQAGAPHRQACRYRDGLLMAFLAARPLRRRNLAGLRIGHSFYRRGTDWWIDIPGDQTKTGTPVSMPLPQELSAACDHYLAEHRPVLAQRRNQRGKDPGDAFWLSWQGTPMSEGALYGSVVLATRATLGRAVNPHLFRDCAATSLAIDDPAHVRIAAPLLGHRSFATTERHYNQAQSHQAAQLWQQHLVALRRRSNNG